MSRGPSRSEGLDAPLQAIHCGKSSMAESCMARDRGHHAPNGCSNWGQNGYHCYYYCYSCFTSFLALLVLLESILSIVRIFTTDITSTTSLGMHRNSLCRDLAYAAFVHGAPGHSHGEAGGGGGGATMGRSAYGMASCGSHRLTA